MSKSKSKVKNVEASFGAGVDLVEPNLEPHPLTEQWPMMEGWQWDAFLEDSEKDEEVGIRIAAVRHEGKLLDGRNRQRLAREKGWLLPVRDFNPDVEGTAERFVVAMNDNRRHEHPDAVAERRRERQQRVAEKKKKGKSDRQIAKEEGISQSQVQRDLKKGSQLNREGSTEPESETVIGIDGKKYSSKKTAEHKKAAKEGAAKKRQGKKPHLQLVTGDPTEVETFQPSQDEAVVDSQENPVPERLKSAFQVAREIGKFAEQFNSWRNKVRLWMDKCESWKDNGDDVLNDIDTLLDHLVDTTPTLVCPE
jgi:hypothetical protein